MPLQNPPIAADHSTYTAHFEGNVNVEDVLTVGGNVNLTGLPTADPHVAGRLWSNAGVLTVSAG